MLLQFLLDEFVLHTRAFLALLGKYEKFACFEEVFFKNKLLN